MADKKIDFNAAFASMKGTTVTPQPRSDISGQFATGAFYDFPTGLAGLPGDIGRLTQSPEGYRTPIPGPSDVLAMLPSTEDVRKFASEATGFTPKPYEQLDTAEKYARTMGSFLPNALTSPQRLISQGAPRLVRGAANIAQRAANVLIPGAVSEAAGQAFQGEALEPYARIAGALVGGRMASGRPSPQAAIKGAEVSLPKLAQQTNAAYEGLRGAGIAYNRNAFTSALDDAASEIKTGGIDSEAVNRIIGNLKGIGPNELDWTRLDTIRQNLSKIAYGGNTVEGDQLAARLVLKRINELETSPNFYMKPGATKMSAQDIADKTKEARDLAARRIKTRQIESIIDLAPTYAGTPENNLRSGFRRLLRDIKKKENVGWTPEEISAIQDVAEGRKIVQALSKLSPSLRESIPGMTAAGSAAIGAGAMFGPAAALAPMAVGVPARIASGARTSLAAERAAGLTSAPRAAQQEAIAAADRARRGIAQRTILTAPVVVPGLLEENRR